MPDSNQQPPDAQLLQTLFGFMVTAEAPSESCKPNPAPSLS